MKARSYFDASTSAGSSSVRSRSSTRSGWRYSAFGIEADLGVEHLQFAVRRHRQRIDFDLRGVGADKRIIQLGDDILGLLGEVAGQAEGRCHRTAVVWHDTRCRIDGQRFDLFGRVVCHGFDVHAALGRYDQRDAPGGAVDEQRQIEFLVDVDAVGDVEPVDLLAVRPGLDGDERVAEHVGRRPADLVGTARQPDPALGLGRQFDLNLPLPRPPAWICALTTYSGPGSLAAAATASSTVSAA